MFNIGDKVRVQGIPHAWCVVDLGDYDRGIVGIAPYDGYHTPREYADTIGIRWEGESALEKVPTRCITQEPLAEGEADAMVDTLASYVLEQVWNHGDEIGQQVSTLEAVDVLTRIAARLVFSGLEATS